MANDFAEAKTTVFWDVEDFPNPDGKSIYEIIKSALENLGYRGEVSIKAYGEKKPDNLNVDDSVIAFAPKRGKPARLDKMLLDICLWSFCCFDDRSDRANLLVIAKTIPKDTLFNSPLLFVSELRLLEQRRNCNVLLVVANDCAPEVTPLPENVSTIWFWESLLDGAKPLSSIEVSKLLAPVDEPESDGSEDEDDGSEDEDDFSGDDDDCRLCHKLHKKLVGGGGGLEVRSMFSVQNK